MKIPLLLPAAALAALLYHGPSAGADACTVVRETYADLPRETVLQVQNALAYFGLYTNRSDAIVGAGTRTGLARYCRLRGLTVGSDPASHQALIDELLRDAAIDRVYHDWRTMLASPGFAPWAAAQQDAEAIHRLVANGTPAQVIAIIDRYLKHRPGAPQPEATPAPPKATAAPPEAQPPQPVVSPAVSSDDRTVSYQLSASDLAALAARSEALDKLAQLKDGGFQDSAAFFAAVEGLLKDNPEAADLLALTRKYVDRQTIFTLGAGDRARLQAAGVPAAVLDRHWSQLENQGYASRDAALQELHTLLAASAPSDGGTPPISGDDSKWAALIASQLGVQAAYRLSAAGWTRIAEAGAVPGYVPAMLKDMQDVDYPLRRLFLSAAQTRIDKALGDDTGKTAAAIKTGGLTKLDDAFIDDLEKQGIPAALRARLAPLKGKAYASADALAAAAEAALQPESGSFADYRAFLAGQARKRHAAEPGKAVAWSAAPGCQCAPAGMQHIAYGFYPYWLDGEPQSVDFGSLSRIGYYAAGFDDRGAVQNTAGWATRNSPAFALAKKFETDLDLVVAKRDWSDWAAHTHEERVAAFAALAGNIATLLDTRPDDPLSRLKPYISLGTNQPTLGSGVTLFFEHYPEGDDYVDEFRGFVAELRERLGGARFVNLMLDKKTLGKGIFSYANLLRWAQIHLGTDEAGTARNDRMRYLVLLAEPYTDDKKNLRTEVEKNLSGDARRNLLRMMVPVIVPDGSGSFKDDVIYMGDNFGGIGLWPLASGEAGADNAAIIKHEYYASGQAGPVCRIVCPNRWLFRLALDIVLLVSLGTLIAYFRCCECRATLRRHFIAILAVTAVPLLLLGAIMFPCDPYMTQHIAQGQLPLFLVLLGIIIYAVWEYGRRRRQIP